MIQWRSAATVVPSMWESVRAAPRGLRLIIPPRFAPPAADTAVGVPWTWLDAGWALLWAAGLAAGGVIGLLFARVLISLFFTVAELSGVVHPGSFALLCADIAPYAGAVTNLLTGGIVYGAVVFAVYRHSVVRYGTGWAVLSLRRLPWRGSLRAAALFIPVTLCGAVLTHTEGALLQGRVHNPQGDAIGASMAPLAANFALLFVLLVIVTPLAEEIVFRGFLYQLLRKRLPVGAAAGASALGFASVHGIAPLLPWLFFMGVVYALVVERTKSLWSSIILHSMSNALAWFAIVVALKGW